MKTVGMGEEGEKRKGWRGRRRRKKGTRRKADLKPTLIYNVLRVCVPGEISFTKSPR